MDDLDIHVSPRVRGVSLVKVPCAFSPIGVHYVKLMWGEKTGVDETNYDYRTRQHKYAAPKTHEHTLHISSECIDTVPVDVLEGMMELRGLSEGPERTSMCAEVADLLKRILYAVDTGEQDIYDFRQGMDRLIATLPRSLKPAVVFLVEQRLHRARAMAERKPEPSYEDMVSNRFTAVFNQAAGMLANSTAFIVCYDQELGFGLANNSGNVLARRLDKRWIVPPWNDRDAWFARVKHQENHYCHVCAKSVGYHDAWAKQHIAAAKRRLMLGLVNTSTFPEIGNRQRVPKDFKKYPGIVVVTQEEYDVLFARKDSSSK